MPSDLVQIPRAHLDFLLRSMDQETADMLIQLSDSISRYKDNPLDERATLIEFMKGSIMHRIEFLLEYKGQYDTMQNWKKIQENLKNLSLT